MADWVIDLGPEGGEGGGEVVVVGTPEDLAGMGVGYTGRFLKSRLRRESDDGKKASARRG